MVESSRVKQAVKHQPIIVLVTNSDISVCSLETSGMFVSGSSTATRRGKFLQNHSSLVLWQTIHILLWCAHHFFLFLINNRC